MYRAAKWKAERSKVKIVFRLQLHATQVPQPGWDKLFVSLIPMETGKAIAKTTKVTVRNGSCKWSDPIYETTTVLQDAKTRKYDEKLYKLVVSMGSSRFGFLGEANINLADYAEAIKPSSVSLPLQSCSAGTILHVIVQPLSAKTGFREFEQQREHTERGFHIVPCEETANCEPDRSLIASEETANGPGVKGEITFKTIALETPWQQLSAKEQKPQNNIEEPEMVTEHLREESLNCSMDRLHKELEKMKNENLASFQQENEILYELGSEDPVQKKVQQLQMVNEQLESMFPGFKDTAKGGYALDRVLALETELAEAMRVNSTQKRHFQSSFVKQHTDQAAVLQSFRDINELINDMLELKRMNTMLEDELKEMQHRYSQLSLQFAEGEGERQQLVMTIKNLKIGKKP